MIHWKLAGRLHSTTPGEEAVNRFLTQHPRTFDKVSQAECQGHKTLVECLQCVECEIVSASVSRVTRWGLCVG